METGQGEGAWIQQSMRNLSQPNVGGNVSLRSGRRTIIAACVGHKSSAIGTARGIDAGGTRSLAQTIAGGACQARQQQQQPRAVTVTKPSRDNRDNNCDDDEELGRLSSDSVSEADGVTIVTGFSFRLRLRVD